MFISGQTGSPLPPLTLWQDKSHNVALTQPLESSPRTVRLSLLFAVSPKRPVRAFTELATLHSFADGGVFYSSRVWLARDHRERIFSWNNGYSHESALSPT